MWIQLILFDQRVYECPDVFDGGSIFLPSGRILAVAPVPPPWATAKRPFGGVHSSGHLSAPRAQSTTYIYLLRWKLFESLHSTSLLIT